MKIIVGNHNYVTPYSYNHITCKSTSISTKMSKYAAATLLLTGAYLGMFSQDDVARKVGTGTLIAASVGAYTYGVKNEKKAKQLNTLYLDALNNSQKQNLRISEHKAILRAERMSKSDRKIGKKKITI